MNDFNAKVIEEFRANGGKVGPPFEGAPMILLTHTGAKTGASYVTPLVYLPNGDRPVIFASKAGAPTNPQWYTNLVANPEVGVEIGTESYRARAVEVTGEERDRLYATMAAAMPNFQQYAEATTRVIPVIALERI